MKTLRIAIGATALAILVGGGPAAAGCFELVGCPDRDPFTEFDLSLFSCTRLNYIRNSIFAEKGYCFEQAKYRKMFGKRSCRYETAAEVPLTAMEKANILRIRRTEAEKTCPR
jgi:hypothetical protein